MSVPTITGPIASRQAFLPADYQFVRDRTDRLVKMTIPGPMTIIDTTKDEYYGDEAALAMDLARAIRVEVEALAAAGCDIVQLDEPCFIRYPQKMLDYGLRAAEACIAGISGNVSPHTLRHCFATHMLAGGAGIRELQELLGHASVATTQLYTQVEHSRLKGIHEQCHPRG